MGCRRLDASQRSRGERGQGVRGMGRDARLLGLVRLVTVIRTVATALVTAPPAILATVSLAINPSQPARPKPPFEPPPDSLPHLPSYSSSTLPVATAAALDLPSPTLKPPSKTFAELLSHHLPTRHIHRPLNPLLSPSPDLTILRVFPHPPTLPPPSPPAFSPPPSFNLNLHFTRPFSRTPSAHKARCAGGVREERRGTTPHKDG